MKNKMKQIVTLLVLASSTYAADNTVADSVVTKESPFRWGIGPVIGTDGFGLSNRIWIKERFGFSINAKSSWDRDIEGGELQLNYKFNTDRPIKPYLLLGGGVQRLNLLDRDPVLYNEPVGFFTAGAGAEALLGESKRHGISLEVAYLNGSIEYNGVSETTMGSAQQQSSKKEESVTPVAARLLYHFYILPSVEKDSDGDGITNKNDKCKNQPEDMDGFMDEDGCPEFDNDNDGILDSLDSCPNKPEDMDGFEDENGCPDFDNDDDKILDSDDSCPNKKEIINQFEDEDGCPDEKPVVKKVIEEIKEEIAEIPVKQIAFELGSAELTTESMDIISILTQFLQKWDSISIEVQGHTDTSGNPVYNKVLSQQRAESVVEALMEMGISKDRLIPVGYGQEEPIASNETREGRIQNRRVEIVVKQ